MRADNGLKNRTEILIEDFNCVGILVSACHEMKSIILLEVSRKEVCDSPLLCIHGLYVVANFGRKKKRPDFRVDSG